MTFYIQQNGQNLDKFECNSHREALKLFRQTYARDCGVILRDFLQYKVDEDTVSACEAYVSINQSLAWIRGDRCSANTSK